MITVQNLSKVYDSGVNAINDISLDIEENEFVFVVGSSGSGKSTFMKMLLKEIEPTSGRILIDGKDTRNIQRRDIPKLRRKLGVVFQDFRLLPNKTVFENISFALEVTEAPLKSIKRNVPAILAMVGLSDKSKVYPYELSGGEQQRVALARAIINKPPILLADEPTGNLDPDTAWEIMELLKEVNSRGTTVLIATHAKDIVDIMKKRVITLQDGIILSDKEGGYDFED